MHKGKHSKDNQKTRTRGRSMKARGTESARQMPGMLIGQGNRDRGMQAGPKSLLSRPWLPGHTTAGQSHIGHPWESW